MPKSSKTSKSDLIKPSSSSKPSKPTNSSTSSHLDKLQVEKAVNALLAHVKRQKEAKDTLDLIDEDEIVWLTLTTKKIGDDVKVKPQRIPLVNSLYDDAEVCLFTKDPQKEFEQLVDQKAPKVVSKVLAISKLRTDYKPYEAKRLLCKTYDLFLADDRILPLLPPLIGKTFFDKKKQPIPIVMSKEDLASELKQAKNSTYMFINRGACSAIKIGKTSMTSKQVVENILLACEGVASKIPKGWSNIQSMHIKTHDSVALPIFNQVLTEQDEKDHQASEEAKRKRKAEEAEKRPKKLKMELNYDSD